MKVLSIVSAIWDLYMIYKNIKSKDYSMALLILMCFILVVLCFFININRIMVI